jgi:hypothetical protein
MRKLPQNLAAKKRRRTNHSVNSRFRSRTSRSHQDHWYRLYKKEK